jgi:dihydrofolate synthase/folylpolyglutamate synthase
MGVVMHISRAEVRGAMVCPPTHGLWPRRTRRVYQTAEGVSNTFALLHPCIWPPIRYNRRRSFPHARMGVLPGSWTKAMHSYQDALDYIYSFTDHSVRPEQRYGPDVVDPTRPARLLGMLGNPHQAYPAIHVAGTKGKGSVAAICASALRAAGLRTGFYTSPHLQSFTERIQLNGQPIGPEILAGLVDDIRPVVDQIEEITTFEVITALAFLFFCRQQVDIAVVEVGLGGRLDATNVIRPLVSVITSLSLDHTYLLGETVAEIAAEKGGIIKAGVPAVSAPQVSEAAAVLKAIAAERRAPLTTIGDRESGADWWYELGEMTLEGQSFRAGRAGEGGDWYRLPLLGPHQVVNATVALAALGTLQDRVQSLENGAIRQGVAAVEWPGRFQILQRSPLVVVDGAHNVDSAIKLRRTLEILFPGRRIILVFGATADKDVEGMIRELGPVASQIITTSAAHPRAMPAAELRSLFEAQNYASATSAGVSEALGLAKRAAGPEDVICITGSLFVVGDALTAWQT